MNRYPRKQLTLGNIEISPLITAEEIGYTSSEEELSQILRTFKFRDILIQLAKINLLLQRGNDFEYDEIALKEYFCKPVVLNRIDTSSSLRGRFIFNRQSTLRLLSECVSVSDPYSNITFDKADSRYNLLKCYLIANSLLDDGNSTSNITSQEEISKRVIVDSIPTMDYAINTSLEYRAKFIMVRSAEYLSRLVDAAKIHLGIEVNQTFFQEIELRIKDYQHLVYSILAAYWKFSPLEVMWRDPSRDSSVFFDTSSVPDLIPLYEKLLPHICISINDLNDEAKKFLRLKNEFLLWRKYPLVKISENQILCIDFYFLLEKLQTGVFWIIRDILEKRCRGDGQKIISLWGDIFEDYATSAIIRGIDAQVPPIEKCVTSLQYHQKEKKECTDIAVSGNETLILLECKSPILRAETKFSGDLDKFDTELKDKIVEGERPKKAKGIKQLCNAIQSLFHIDETQRKSIIEIDISRISKVYPVLVLFDRMFSAPLMNRYLDSEYERLMKGIELKGDLNIKPLTVLTIEDLESLEPYLSDTPFHVHLDNWMQWRASRNSNDKLSFSSFLYPLNS